MKKPEARRRERTRPGRSEGRGGRRLRIRPEKPRFPALQQARGGEDGSSVVLDLGPALRHNGTSAESGGRGSRGLQQRPAGARVPQRRATRTRFVKVGRAWVLSLGGVERPCRSSQPGGGSVRGSSFATWSGPRSRRGRRGSGVGSVCSSQTEWAGSASSVCWLSLSTEERDNTAQSSPRSNLVVPAPRERSGPTSQTK